MENKPICEIDEYGNKKWYINGVLHREDGPAIEDAYGTNCWYKNGKLHRIDGPTIVWIDGSYVWFINGYDVTLEIAQWAKDNDINLSRLTIGDKALIKLVWADYGK